MATSKDTAPSKRKASENPLKEQLKLLETYHERKKIGGIETKLKKLIRVYVTGRQDTADKLKELKEWFESVCEELGDSTTKDLKTLKIQIEKVQKDCNDGSATLFTASQHIVAHHHAIAQQDRNLKTALHEVRQLIIESNKKANEDQLQVSLIEKMINTHQNDIAKLKNDMAMVLDQNVELQKHISELEAK